MSKGTKITIYLLSLLCVLSITLLIGFIIKPDLELFQQIQQGFKAKKNSVVKLKNDTKEDTTKTGSVIYDLWSLDNKKLKELAKNGDAYAQVFLAENYYRGERGFKEDFKEAKKWLDLAFAQKHPLSFYLLGKSYSEGLGVEKDKTKSKKFFDKSFLLLKKYEKEAELYDPRWITNLGFCYLGAYGVDKNEEEALSLFTLASNKKYLRSVEKILHIAYSYARNKDRTIFKKRLEILTKYSKQTSKDAQALLGIAYYHGYFGETEKSKALPLLINSLKNTNTKKSLFKYQKAIIEKVIGYIYFEGIGVGCVD